MKFLIAVTLIFATFSSQAADSSAIENFKEALKMNVGDLSHSQELRITVIETNESICGSDEPMLIANLEVARTFRKDNGGEGIMGFTTEWELVKSYVVSVEEARTTKPELMPIMADDTCLE